MKKLITAFLSLALMLSASGGVSYAETENETYSGIFEEYAAYEGNVPEVLDSEEWTDKSTDDVCVKKIHYKSYNDSKIYAVVAYPRTSGNYPGRLSLHGGGMCANDKVGDVITFAKAGYVAIAPDLPGILGSNKLDNSDGAWKDNYNYETDMFKFNTDEKDSVLYDALTSAIYAFHLLQSGNLTGDASVKVDMDHIGISGVSWGGYTTTMLSGILGDQVKAAYALFGTGNYDVGEYWNVKNRCLNLMSEEAREKWLANYDAGRVSKYTTCDFFEAAATNDTYFTPTMTQKTLDSMQGYTNMLYSPNTDHTIMVDGVRYWNTDIEQKWFNYLLKGEGEALPKITYRNANSEINNYSVTYDVPDNTTAENIKAYYSYRSDGLWTKRKWVQIDSDCIEVNGNAATVNIPDELMTGSVDVFASLTDGSTYTVSSYVQTLKKGNAQYDVNMNYNQEKNSAEITGTVPAGYDVMLLCANPASTNDDIYYFDTANNVGEQFNFSVPMSAAEFYGKYKFTIGINGKDEYTAKIDYIYPFVGSGYDFEKFAVTGKYEANGTLTAAVSTTDTERTYNILFALFDKATGELKKVKMGQNSAEMTLPEDTSGTCVRAFLWDMSNAQTPITDTICVNPAN